VCNGQVVRERDVLVVEEPLEIRVASDAGEVQVAVIMRTPGEDFELAAGFLFDEGLLHSRDEIGEIRYCCDDAPVAASPLGRFADGMAQVGGMESYNIVTVHLRPGVRFDAARIQRNFYATSSCGVCGKASLEALALRGCAPLARDEFCIEAGVISRLDAVLRSRQSLFTKTGGLHAAALFDSQGQLLTLHEDVGRHSALDKLIGKRFLDHQLPISRHLVMVSGRASFEIMQKALMARAPVVAAVGAPSSLAVELAQAFNMTLIGFVRGERFNIYAGAWRIAQVVH
jgi:FdhD protein